VMVFSHGLGGSRNAYSQILGTLASHGIVVIAPDHRDSSAPISYLRATENTPARSVGYQRYPHNPTPEVYAGRDKQLKIRLWEIGLIHDALLRIEDGHYPENLDPNSSGRKKKDRNDVLKMFVGKLDVHRPGAIVWGGHSFGAATTVQIVKSTYWQTSAKQEDRIQATPIFNPSPTSRLAQQITPSSPVVLLDMWCLPFRSPETRALWEKPMPCYSNSGAGGSALLSISSEAFFVWKGNMKDTKRVISPPAGSQKSGPKSFYPKASAHLSQSDFGVLFPWVTQKFLKTDHPEGYITLNARAILQVLRENGYDLALSKKLSPEDNAQQSDASSAKAQKKGLDWRILDADGAIPGWNVINITQLHADTSNVSVENDVQSPSDTVETEVLGEVNI
jgi:platelet-activating factor acetylhydrolase